MSLEERTLVVRNFDDQVTKELLHELFQQAGPVVNVVLRSDHAFIEFQHRDSVGYAMALMDGVSLFDQTLSLEPKLRQEPDYYQYKRNMEQFNQFMRFNPNHFLQYMSEEEQKRILDKAAEDYARSAGQRQSSHNSTHRHSYENRHLMNGHHSGGHRNSDGYRHQSNDYSRHNQRQYHQQSPHYPSYQYQDRQSYNTYNSRKRQSYPM